MEKNWQKLKMQQFYQIDKPLNTELRPSRNLENQKNEEELFEKSDDQIS